MTVCYFSLLFECARAHTLKINALFVRRLSFSIPGWCYGLLLPFSFSSLVVVLLCIFFLYLASWVRYSTRDIHKQQAVSWYKQTPRFHKVFFFSSSRHLNVKRSTNRTGKRLSSLVSISFIYCQIFFFSSSPSHLCKTNLSSNQSVVNRNSK